MKNGAFDYYDHLSQPKQIAIKRVQIVQDIAEQFNANNISYLDFNRAGMGMLKIFTANEITHPADAPLLIRQMRMLLRHLLISKANFDKSSMRCKVLVQLSPDGNPQAPQVVYQNLRSYDEVHNTI